MASSKDINPSSEKSDVILTKRRPKMPIRDLIDIEDFRNHEEPKLLKARYEKKRDVSKILNETYVNLELAEEINGWSSRKKQAILGWKNLVEYQFIVNWFFVFELKKTEGFWSWLIIIISTITSTFSLIRSDIIPLKTTIETSVSVLSVLTTLIAAWMKKQAYVERIKNLDRYIQRLSKLNVEMNYILDKPPWDRMTYDKFIEQYESQIILLLSSPPPMSPEEFKTSVWRLTRYYPEIVKDTYPWFKKNTKGCHVMTDWGGDILRTYEAVYYSSAFRRIFSCYYCLCKCCCKLGSGCKRDKDYITQLYNSGGCLAETGDEESNEWPPLPGSHENSLAKHIAQVQDLKLDVTDVLEIPLRDGEKIIELAAAMKSKEHKSIETGELGAA